MLIPNYTQFVAACKSAYSIEVAHEVAELRSGQVSLK
jgi:hypothetical protein